jgi:hypothetical protein
VKIYTPEQSAIILRTMTDIQAGNNGWSFIPAHAWLHDALTVAGYVVIRSTDYHGNPAFKGYTKAAQAALRGQPYAVSTYKPVRIDATPDYEAAILARQERETMDT